MFEKYRSIDVIKNSCEVYHKLKTLIAHISKNDFSHEHDFHLNALTHIFVEPTNLCNLQCDFCVLEVGRKKQKMNFDAFKRIVDSMETGSYFIATGNGEPLLNHEIYNMIEYASTRGMFVSIITNASALNQKNRIKLIESGVSRVQFSFQSIDKETNESIMKGSE